MRDNKRPPHRGDPLPQQIRQSPEKLYRSRNPQPTPLRHSLSEVLCVVRQQPIRLRLHRGEQHRHIRRMANQPSTSNHRVQLRKRDHLRPGQFNESAIVLNDAICLLRRKTLRLDKQVLFHFLANRLGQHQLADPGRAKRQHCLIKSPRSNNASGQHIGIKKQPKLAGHFFQRGDAATETSDRAGAALP